MSLHYQVNTNFKFIKGKISLIGLSIISTKSACTTIPQQLGKSLLKTYRILPTLEHAQTFIAYLKKVYPQSEHLPVKLFLGVQNELF